MYSFSLEQLGTTARAYLTPIGPDGERESGLVLADFGLKLLNPSLTDISGSTAITVEEFEVEGVGQGSYIFQVPLPTTGEGNYSLRITDGFGDYNYCVFMAYNFPPHTTTADSTAQVEIEAYESNGDPVTSLTLGELTTRIYSPSGVDSYALVSPVLTKIEDGRFQISWDGSSEEGEWFLDTVSEDYFSGGQQAIWRYQVPTDYTSPSIDDVDVSEDGLTITAELTVGDAPYVAARLLSSEGIQRDEDLRSGSGILILTRTLSETGVLVVYGADEDGYPYGDPVAQVITGSHIVGGADDNVAVAIRTMKQTATYWAMEGLDEFGKPTWDDPVAIKCRWDMVQEEFVGPNGDREMSKARLMVDRDLTIKGVLILSTVEDVEDSDDPKDNEGAWEIRQFMKSPDFKGRKYLREVYL